MHRQGRKNVASSFSSILTPDFISRSDMTCRQQTLPTICILELLRHLLAEAHFRVIIYTIQCKMGKRRACFLQDLQGIMPVQAQFK